MELTEKMYIEDGNSASNVQELFKIIINNSRREEILSYEDEDCSHCTENIGGGWRSFEAIFNIVNTYFEASKEEVAYYATKKLYSIFCPDVEKVVFYTDPNALGRDPEYNNYVYYGSEDEYKKGVDDLSYKDIEDMGKIFKLEKEKENGTVS